VREIGLRYRNQSAKAETLTAPVGNRVGIRRGPGANRKEGPCHSLARRVKGQQERVVRGNGPFLGPLEVWRVDHRSSAECGEDRERNILGETGWNNMRDQRVEIRKWLGPVGVLKRTVWWPSGQVRIGNVVSDASYTLLRERRASMTGSVECHPPCSCCLGVDLKPIPRARLTHRPDDGGRKDL
jgi:hypothetical protein